MLSHILKVIALTLCTNILIANAVTTYDVGIETNVIKYIPNDVATLKQILYRTTEKYGIPDQNQLLTEVIRCESTFKVNAINHTDREYSVGLVQINLFAHKNITEEQAKDPVFAIEFLVKNVSEGRGYWWTCYRTLTSR
jgi:hypothetical protein